MFLELDYLAGPGGLGVQGVIGDCPTALIEWSRSLQWCERPACQPIGCLSSASEPLLTVCNTGAILSVLHQQRWHQ